jgi:hypothetical protein
MKIRYPLGEYYNCLSINKYIEDIFDENDDYIIIEYEYESGSDNGSLVLTHKSN